MTNSLNFRDCGGYDTGNGRRVKTGMLFRSASLDRVAGRNRAMILDKKIKTVIDLRPDSERPKQIAALPGIRRLSIPLDADRMARERVLPHIRKRHGEQDIYRAVESVYYDIVALHPVSVRNLFSQLSQPDLYPLCLNCRAGKDRTGFAVALILRTLGVADTDIIKDFLATNANLLPLVRRITLPLRLLSFGLLPTGNWEAALIALERYLTTAFNRIDHDYGGIEGYLDFCGIPQIWRKKVRTYLCELPNP